MALGSKKLNLMEGFVKTFEGSFPPHVRMIMLPALVATMTNHDLGDSWDEIKKLLPDDVVVRSRAAAVFDMTEKWVIAERELRQAQLLERGGPVSAD